MVLKKDLELNMSAPLSVLLLRDQEQLPLLFMFEENKRENPSPMLRQLTITN